MALSGNSGWINFGPYNSFGIYLGWSATQNVAGNYSDVTGSIAIRSNNGGSYFTYTSSIGLQINGTSKDANKSVTLNPNSQLTVHSATVRVPHNADGSKSFTIYFNFSNPVTGSSGTKSLAVSLNGIPRVSSLTWDSSTFPHTYGKDGKLTVNSGSSDFYHSLELRTRGVLRGTLFSNSKGGGVKTFNIPLNWANNAGDTVLDNCSFRLITHTKSGSYGSDSLIGYKDYSGQISVPDNIVPTISSVTYADQSTDVKAITGSDQILVQGKSMPQIAVIASGAYSSLITKYRIEIGGAVYDRPGRLYTIDLGDLPNLSGSQTVKVTVTDTRGRTATMSNTLDIRPYSLPTITNVTLSRKSTDKTIGLLTKSVSVSSIKNGTTEKNTYTVTIQTKKTTETAWNTIKTETNTSQTNYEIANCSIDSSYNVKLIVQDKWNTVPTEAILQTDKIFMDKHRDEGLGILKYHESGKGALQVGGETWAEGYRDLTGRKLIDMFYPIGSIFQSVVATDPSTFMGGTWIRIGQGQVLVGVNESDSDFNAPGKTGGEKTHILNTSSNKATNEIGATSVGKEIPGSGDGLTITPRFAGRVAVFLDKTIEANPHNNMQPYTTVYMWRRTA